MSNSDGDEEDIIDYYQYRELRRIRREHWVHPYIKENANLRLFVAAQELSQTDRKFIAFYGTSKQQIEYIIIYYISTNISLIIQ